MDHSPEYRQRRFLNWFPLGLTYAAMYMGRYNFNVVKNDIGAWYHLDKAQMGLIATAGFWTYGLSVALNGPLADRFGGRRAILVGAVGAALLNLAIGLMFLNGMTTKLLVSMSLLWSLNMYFQSFGALSVVKVNSTWFHVKERGVFGGIFGIMISSGYFFATTIGAWILARLHWTMIWFIPAAAIFAMYLVDLFLVRNRPSHAGHADFDTGDGSNAHHAEDAPLPLLDLMKKVFHNPVIVALIFAEFCTGFVRQGVMLYFTEYLSEVYQVSKQAPVVVPLRDVLPGRSPWIVGLLVGGSLSAWLVNWLFNRVIQSPSRDSSVALSEQTTARYRSAWVSAGFIVGGLFIGWVLWLLGKPWALYLFTGPGFMLGGIFGGLLCGWMSDKLFQSRRPPVAFVFYLVQVAMLLLLGATLGQGSVGGQVWAISLLGLTAMFIFGVHGMLSGTASMDFGGRKAAATVAGALDGIQYIGSGLTGFGLGWVLKTYGWDGTPLVLAGAGAHGHQPQNAWVWVGCIIPFSLVGAFIMTRIWHAKPGAGAH